MKRVTCLAGCLLLIGCGGGDAVEGAAGSAAIEGAPMPGAVVPQAATAARWR